MDNTRKEYGIEFHLVGDYYLPNLIPPKERNIGLRGELRRNFFAEHHKGIYTGLLLSGKLNSHLGEINC